MSNIIKLIEYEEGWRSRPYLCSEGYPSVGFGFKIGPKNASITAYQFALPIAAGRQWMDSVLDTLTNEMMQYKEVSDAIDVCNDARRAVLISMAYQMGVQGLTTFKRTLRATANEDWPEVSMEMMKSRWARQTPSRALRHSQQMQSGIWFAGYA